MYLQLVRAEHRRREQRGQLEGALGRLGRRRLAHEERLQRLGVVARQPVPGARRADVHVREAVHEVLVHGPRVAAEERAEAELPLLGRHGLLQVREQAVALPQQLAQVPRRRGVRLLVGLARRREAAAAILPRLSHGEVRRVELARAAAAAAAATAALVLALCEPPELELHLLGRHVAVEGRAARHLR